MQKTFERGDLLHIPSETNLFQKGDFAGVAFYKNLTTFPRPIIGYYLSDHENETKIFYGGQVYYVNKNDIYELRF